MLEVSSQIACGSRVSMGQSPAKLRPRSRPDLVTFSSAYGQLWPSGVRCGFAEGVGFLREERRSFICVRILLNRRRWRRVALLERLSLWSSWEYETKIA